MKNDVFISYSRKDTNEAQALCRALKANGVSYWIDESIHGSANFLTEIVGRIKECRVVVFIASANSAASEWTQKEILYALKHKKEIIPYKIGEFSFDDNDELDFVFTNIQWVCSEGAVVEALRIKGLTNAISSVQAIPAAQPAVSAQPKPASHPTSQPTPKTYKVGDYYDDGTKQGVVFDVWDGGRHGKIVSLDQNKSKWCTNEQIVIGADSKSNGKANTDKVMARGDANQYPAFTWCRNKGADWYLPAIDELKLLLLNDSVHDAVNITLAQKGGTKLYNKKDLSWYWSSTERDESGAWFVDMFDGYTKLISKGFPNFVRAVSAF
ncbi:MAG: TIR domain-containing protein [Tidjanibacter sp.]|nr:TIR domain-containing protein [Tidjanibacter sp.]